MTVVRYEPWALVNRLQKDIDRLFGAPQTTATDSGAWLPPVDSCFRAIIPREFLKYP